MLKIVSYRLYKSGYLFKDRSKIYLSALLQWNKIKCVDCILPLILSKNVKKFEEEWSKWLGVKYSVFVNSGSSANFLTMACLKEMGLKGEIILPSLTWISDVVSVIKNGFKPRVCVTCNLEFEWRKKWAKNWENVKYCSEKCSRSKKKLLK